MTTPSDYNLPVRPINNSPKEQEAYLTDLTFKLERAFETLSDGINGQFRSDVLLEKENFTPVLQGSTNGTFTYTHQTAWVLRKGLIIDLWFDVQWSATTASGNLYLILPYKVARTNNIPFVGLVQPSNVAYTAGTEIVINALSNTYEGYFYNSGNGIATTNQSVVGSGRLIGYLRYIGQQDE